jgi:DNA-binding CsgD family transcriptional regulator
MSSSSVFRMLTNTERMVLGIIGDGTDDKAAARQLVLAVSTIRSVRESLHRKFGIQQKSELMACAERAGFVIRTSHGIVRPDLWRLRQAHFSGVGGRSRNTLVRQVA